MPFKSRQQFFYLMYNEPKVWKKWVKKYGVPKNLGLGTKRSWEKKMRTMRAESYSPPASAVANAKRGLKLRKEYGRGGLSPSEAKAQGIDSGVTRAKHIASGKVSKHDVRRMSAFNRHRKNYRPEKKMPDGGPTAGTIAWLLWGGTSGVNWAKKKSATMSAEEGWIDEEQVALRVKTLRGGVQNFEEDKAKLKKGDLMIPFLDGAINAFQTAIRGVNVVGVEKTLEEISVKFLPKAEDRAEMMAVDENTEKEHYHMGEVWGYDEVIDFLNPFPSNFIRSFSADEIDIDIDLDDTLTTKELKMVMWYPLIVGFLGGTIANVASNYLTVHWLKKNGHI